MYWFLWNRMNSGSHFIFWCLNLINFLGRGFSNWCTGGLGTHLQVVNLTKQQFYARAWISDAVGPWISDAGDLQSCFWNSRSIWCLEWNLGAYCVFWQSYYHQLPKSCSIMRNSKFLVFVPSFERSIWIFSVSEFLKKYFSQKSE